jgi:hypothetical protein
VGFPSSPSATPNSPFLQSIIQPKGPRAGAKNQWQISYRIHRLKLRFYEPASPIADVTALNLIASRSTPTTVCIAGTGQENTTYSGMRGNMILFLADRQDRLCERLNRKIALLDQRLTILEERGRSP